MTGDGDDRADGAAAADEVDPQQVAAVRDFARTTTARLGVLDEHWLGRGRPLNQSRLLFELRHGAIELPTLRARLGLDSGYASRLVHGLADDGLVAVRAHPDDARVRVIALTAAGRTEVEVLDETSDRVAADLVAPLDPRRRARLVEAMTTVTGLLDAAAVVVDDVDPTAPVVAEAHARYAAELAARFPSGFDPGDPAADVDRYRPPRGACVGAWLDDRFVGTVALAPLAPRDEDDRVARPLGEVKRMWVADDARGLGVGRRLLGAIVARARRTGHATLRLDTNGALTAAMALYESAGWRRIERYNDNPYATHFMQLDLTDRPRPVR